MCLIVQNSLACIIRNEVCSLVLRALDDTHSYMRHSLMYFKNSAKVLFNFKVLDPITFYTPFAILNLNLEIYNESNEYLWKYKKIQIEYKTHTNYLLSEADSLTQN